MSSPVAPLDADNHFCGEGELSDFPYLYLSDLDDVNINQIFKSGVCVRTCPTSANLEKLDCHPNSKVPDCKITEHMRYESRPFVGYCVP